MGSHETTQGSCLCGESKYSFTGEPAMSGICHCMSCRKLTSSVFSTVVLVPRDAFTYDQETPIQTVDVKHETGIPMTIFHCGKCGSSLWKEADTDAFRGLAMVFAGTIDDGGVILGKPPQLELWRKYHLDWVGEVNGSPQKCEQFA